MTAPLRIGILGAARIADDGIVGPAMRADAALRRPEVDASMRVQLAYPGGVTGLCVWDMDAAERIMTWSVTGTQGTATSPAFAVPTWTTGSR